MAFCPRLTCISWGWACSDLVNAMHQPGQVPRGGRHLAVHALPEEPVYGDCAWPGPGP